jgi:hypothetical protein
MIPYILNENKRFGQHKLIEHYYHSIENQDIINKKTIDVGFFGNFHRTKALQNARKFLLEFNFQNFNHFIGKGEEAERYLPNIKYLFVLRGDTPTRLCFYQCFAFNTIPIIYEDEVELYSHLLLPDINIRDSVFILPSVFTNIDCKQIELLLQTEFSNSNNYLQKIKNHKEIFNQLNYFKQPLCNPIKNAMEKIYQTKRG